MLDRGYGVRLKTRSPVNRLYPTADNVTIRPEVDGRQINRLMDGNQVSAACQWEAKGATQAPQQFETIIEVRKIAYASRRIA